MNLMRYLVWRDAAARYRRGPKELTAEERKAVESQAAREHRVITVALAASEAEAVHAEDEVVRAAVAALSEAHGEREAFLAALAEAGLGEEGLYRAVADELRAGVVLERIGDAAVVPEESVRAYYMRHRSRMVAPERRAARHILITVDDSPENARAAVCERLARVAEAIASGAGFEEMALRHSECPTALEGGRLGEVRRGQLYPELDAALFSMEPGELRTAESPLGVHLLCCDAVIPPQAISYEAAAPAIRKKMEAAAREREQKRWLAGRETGLEPPVPPGPTPC